MSVCAEVFISIFNRYIHGHQSAIQEPVISDDEYEYASASDITGVNHGIN